MAEFFEYDPLTGIKTETEFNELTNEITLIRTADVEPLYNIAQKVRNEVGKDAHGKKEGWHHYATIPPIEQVKMFQRGYKLDGLDTKSLLTYINQRIPECKMTTGNEGPKSLPIYSIPK